MNMAATGANTDSLSNFLGNMEWRGGEGSETWWDEETREVSLVGKGAVFETTEEKGRGNMRTKYVHKETDRVKLLQFTSVEDTLKTWNVFTWIFDFDLRSW